MVVSISLGQTAGLIIGNGRGGRNLVVIGRQRRFP
jgi:hypothetical protein